MILTHNLHMFQDILEHKVENKRNKLIKSHDKKDCEGKTNSQNCYRGFQGAILKIMWITVLHL